MTFVQPVILSGGAGTRLWPLSRALYPKQFIRFIEGQEASFLGTTLQRLSSHDGFEKPILLCSNDHRFLVREELEATGIEADAIILEPIARNTAAPIAVAALKAVSETPDAIIAVMPSDHDLRDSKSFSKAVRYAANVAATKKLVLFGIRPREPHTGYGYIRQGAQLDGFAGQVFEVGAFFEKPEQSVAEQYFASGEYFWNSGIFVLHAQTLLEEFEIYAPDVLEAARNALADAEEDLEFIRLDKTALSQAPNISIDYAIMENTKQAAMLPLDIAWSDVGAWSSLWQIAPHDEGGNYTLGEAVLEDTSNCYIHSERALVAAIGIDDLIIVNTPDALLVADKGRSQDVSKIVQNLKLANRREQEQHLRTYRPWGYFETLALGSRVQVKKLYVKPGGQLSMQMHHHRSEHWVVVSGTALIQIGDQEQYIRENESIYISATQWHRLTNPGKVPLELIEVQIGSYLGEDDIIRSDDIYNRTAEETK